MRERDRDRDRQTDRQRGRGREIVYVIMSEYAGACVFACEFQVVSSPSLFHSRKTWVTYMGVGGWRGRDKKKRNK